eukprot:scaffold7214_cov410-Prasinococcus_capsulatus_cf.AAC.16
MDRVDGEPLSDCWRREVDCTTPRLGGEETAAGHPPPPRISAGAWQIRLAFAAVRLAECRTPIAP